MKKTTKKAKAKQPMKKAAKKPVKKPLKKAKPANKDIEMMAQTSAATAMESQTHDTHSETVEPNSEVAEAVEPPAADSENMTPEAEPMGSELASEQTTSFQSSMETVDHDMHAPSPPSWYLCTVVALNLVGLYLYHLVANNSPYTEYIGMFDFYFSYIWFGLNIAMIWYLHKHLSKKSAYILPVYFVVFFVLMQVFWLCVKSSETSTDLFLTPLKVIAVITAAFEILTALLQLRMRRNHAR